jgi:hypothetical protein
MMITGRKNVPGIYSNIPELLKWINSIKCSDSGYSAEEAEDSYSPTKGPNYEEDDSAADYTQESTKRPKPKPRKPKHEPIETY